MRRIGIIYGMENTFPTALVNRINERNIPEVVAEHVRIGAVRLGEPSGYRVLIDRVSHDVEFFASYLRNAVLSGTTVINNPFDSSADNQFFNLGLARRLGIEVPRTVVLPHKAHPPGTTVSSMRNLVFPLDWNGIFAYVGFPAFLKPVSGAAWKNTHRVHSAEQFFHAYDQTGSTGMMLQAAIPFEEFFRCYVIGREHVRVMRYDSTQPHHSRYSQTGLASTPELLARLEDCSLKLCKTLGSDFTMLEFAVQGGTPYAVDFLSPAADADGHILGAQNFEWLVDHMADLAIARALEPITEERSMLPGTLRSQITAIAAG
jgi:glutathione synthase/RimK-type ligase-like ATP-grasp enzyme